jgi:hypothetical protein
MKIWNIKISKSNKSKFCYKAKETKKCKKPCNKSSKLLYFTFNICNNFFQGVLYQCFEGLYYKRYHRTNITISISSLLLRGKRERERKKYSRHFESA